MKLVTSYSVHSWLTQTKCDNAESFWNVHGLRPKFFACSVIQYIFQNILPIIVGIYFDASFKKYKQIAIIGRKPSSWLAYELGWLTQGKDFQMAPLASQPHHNVQLLLELEMVSHSRRPYLAVSYLWPSEASLKSLIFFMRNVMGIYFLELQWLFSFFFNMCWIQAYDMLASHLSTTATIISFDLILHLSHQTLLRLHFFVHILGVLQCC